MLPCGWDHLWVFGGGAGLAISSLVIPRCSERSSEAWLAWCGLPSGLLGDGSNGPASCGGAGGGRLGVSICMGLGWRRGSACGGGGA